MKLILFDIDGTILDSVNADDACFIETFKNLYEIDVSNESWNDFKNVTDLGLTIEIFENFLKRLPTEKEVARIKTHFYNLLSSRINDFTEIEGALSFIASISQDPDFEIGFATGGWKETAQLKCNAIALNLDNYIFKSSSDHFNRAKIIELVIADALLKNNLTKFETIIYFGDGLWDLKTTKELGIEFIGVDYKNNNKLSVAGAEKIIRNYNVSEEIIHWLKIKN